MKVLSQGETVIWGTYSFNPASGSVPDNMLFWELVDEETCRLTPLNGVEVAHLGNPHLGWVTPQQLIDTIYSSEPIEGSLTGVGQISPGSIIAVRSGPVYAKIRINGVFDARNLGVSWVTYRD